MSDDVQKRAALNRKGTPMRTPDQIHILVVLVVLVLVASTAKVSAQLSGHNTKGDFGVLGGSQAPIATGERARGQAYSSRSVSGSSVSATRNSSQTRNYSDRSGGRLRLGAPGPRARAMYSRSEPDPQGLRRGIRRRSALFGSSLGRAAREFAIIKLQDAPGR